MQGAPMRDVRKYHWRVRNGHSDGETARRREETAVWRERAEKARHSRTMAHRC